MIFANLCLGHFAGIDFRELGLTKDFTKINFRKRNLYKDFSEINFVFALSNILSMTLVYGFVNDLTKNHYFLIKQVTKYPIGLKKANL